MEDEPEVIRDQMRVNRAALAEKLETLEQRVMNVADTVSCAVENVTEGVQETVKTVKETFDIRGQFERHPFVMAGGWVGAGFVAALLLPRHSNGVSSRHIVRGVSETPPPPPVTPATESHASLLEKPLVHLRDLAVGSLLGVAREVIAQAVPRSLADTARQSFDDATARLGGRSSPRSVENTVR